ncbi:hypothetical protein DSO57_1035948 [Entomophthora muscae]|uniref:Uncharacterized protein n=1 Tax=Entomophthora muscae TaxID=34485 RepID=A0ACC2RE42_9FUNG|nr:hypothetical protein DSO57_1035948 [Entomophthora muscae]
MGSTAQLPYFILEKIIQLLPIDYIYELLYADRRHNIIISRLIFQRLIPKQNVPWDAFLTLLIKYGKICKELEIPPRFDAERDSFPIEPNVFLNVTSLRLHAKDSRTVIAILPRFYTNLKLTKLSLSYLSPKVHLSCIGGITSRLTEIFVNFEEYGNFRQLFEITCPSLVKLTANVPIDDLDSVNGIELHFPRLRELNIFKRFRGSNYSLLWVNFQTGRFRAVGCFDKGTGVMFSYRLHEGNRLANLQPALGFAVIYRMMNALFSHIIFRQKRRTNPHIEAFYYNAKTIDDENLLFRKDCASCIIFEVEDISKLLLPEIAHVASILRFRGLKVVPARLLNWIFRCFTCLRVLELDDPIDKEAWSGTLKTLECFISSNAYLITLTRLIAAAPRLKIIYSNLAPSKLLALKTIGPNVLFKPYSRADQEMDPFRLDDSLNSLMD